MNMVEKEYSLVHTCESDMISHRIEAISAAEEFYQNDLVDPVWGYIDISFGYLRGIVFIAYRSNWIHLDQMPCKQGLSAANVMKKT